MSAPTGAREFAGRARAATATNVAIMVAAAIAIFVIVNYLGGQTRFRKQWDVTDVGANTLSARTIGILKELPKKLGADASGRDRIVELVSYLVPQAELDVRAIEMVHQRLDVYRANAGGRIVVTKFDPVAQLSAARAKAKDLKLKEIRSEVVVALGDRVRNVRLEDMVRMNHGSRFGPREEPPRIEEDRIEEAITSNLLALVEEAKPKAYFLAGHGEPPLHDSEAEGLSLLADALRKASYDVSALDLAEKGGVPADASVVLWISPRKPMAEIELAALRQYSQRGGRLLVAFDPAMDPGSDRDVLSILGDFGVRSPEGQVCEPIPDLLTGQAIVGTPQCGILMIRSGDLSSAHPVTKSLFEQQIRLELENARALERVPDTASVALVEDLAKTSRYGWIDLPSGDFIPERPDAAGATKEPMGPRTIAAAITWTPSGASSAPGAATAPASKPAPDDAERGGRAIVLGATFWLRNRGFVYGRDLTLSAVEWLAGREFAAGIGPRPLRKDSLADVTAITPRVTNSTAALALGSFALAGAVVYRRRRLKPGLVVAGVLGALAVFCFALGWLA